MSVQIAQLQAEHHHDGFGISNPLPRLSWRFDSTTLKSWRQASYEIVIRWNGEEAKAERYEFKSSNSVLVPWPTRPLSSRDSVKVKVCATGEDGSKTNDSTLVIEAALLQHADWKAKLIASPQQPEDKPKKPFRLRKLFKLDHATPGVRARLYSTARGIYQVEINGQVVGDQLLMPGWQSYHHRLHYQVFDVGHLLRPGDNVIGAYVGEGWYAGRLGRPGVSNIWGSRPAFLGQIEVDGEVVCSTDSTWSHLDGPVVDSEIYNGETFDTRLDDPSWCLPETDQRDGELCLAQELAFPSATLTTGEAAPVRRVKEIQAKELIITPSGKKILDFGENLVGWLRINTNIPGTGQLVIKHAEVLEDGELGTRPLRTAKAQATIQLGGRSIQGYEPRFTWYGFRYAEISGHDALGLADFTAIAISSDIRPTGSFNCSHDLINKLHDNTIRSMRGNFVSVPTDCPQRDERLGWTGDIQVFAPTAGYLFDTTGFLGGWLQDLEADQRDLDGVVPNIIPAIPIPPRFPEKRPMAVWADAAILTPWDLYTSSGDQAILSRQWESMRLWLDKGIPRDERGFYSTASPQYGDWLDPRAPPHLPGHSPTDAFLIANAYLVHVTALAGKIGRILEKPEAESYTAEATRLRGLYRREYISASGRLASDTQAAYAVALRFELFEGEEELATARSRLDWMVRWEAFNITTGFAGTPIILHVLADYDMLQHAYRMLQEPECPSWLYPVTMGATTIWERWNSMLPDGKINPGQMTSFNHYALGSVCSFLHHVVAGLSPESPGWKRALVKPRPGGTIRHASTRFDSPYGPYSVRWKIEGGVMKTQVEVPPNGEARVCLDGVDEIVGSGHYEFETMWTEDSSWPPKAIQGAQGNAMPDEYLA